MAYPLYGISVSLKAFSFEVSNNRPHTQLTLMPGVILGHLLKVKIHWRVKAFHIRATQLMTKLLDVNVLTINLRLCRCSWVAIKLTNPSYQPQNKFNSQRGRQYLKTYSLYILTQPWSLTNSESVNVYLKDIVVILWFYYQVCRSD